MHSCARLASLEARAAAELGHVVQDAQRPPPRTEPRAALPFLPVGRGGSPGSGVRSKWEGVGAKLLAVRWPDAAPVSVPPVCLSVWAHVEEEGGSGLGVTRPWGNGGDEKSPRPSCGRSSRRPRRTDGPRGLRRSVSRAGPWGPWHWSLASEPKKETGNHRPVRGARGPGSARRTLPFLWEQRKHQVRGAAPFPDLPIGASPRDKNRPISIMTVKSQAISSLTRARWTSGESRGARAGSEPHGTERLGPAVRTLCVQTRLHGGCVTQRCAPRSPAGPRTPAGPRAHTPGNVPAPAVLSVWPSADSPEPIHRWPPASRSPRRRLSGSFSLRRATG